MIYYNEIDPFAAEWLCSLINHGYIAPGVVDTRSIEDVRPSELRGFTQCHFFAGIGVWSYALRQAGWPDDRPVWTGSCPCQPFSTAGKGKGFADERHLWPAFFHLIEQCRPVTVFGEQVASKDGLTWIDLVQTDMEGTGYAFGAVDSCAAGFGAPHLRQRLYWAADTSSRRRQLFEEISGEYGPMDGSAKPISDVGGFRHVCSMADTQSQRSGERHPDSCGGVKGGRPEERPECFSGGPTCGMADTLNEGLERLTRNGGRGNESGRVDAGQIGSASEGNESCNPGPVNGFWRNADWIFCRDGKWRAVEPEIFPLVDGASNRVGILRGAGNAIVAPQAEAFIRAFMELEND